MICPCKGCTERTITCHGFCERYQAWKKYDGEKKTWLREQIPILNDRALNQQTKKLRKRARGWSSKGGTKNYE